MNLAMTSGMIAAGGAEALAVGDVSAPRLSRYAKELKESFVLREPGHVERAIGFMHHDRLFTAYPQVVSALMEDIYRSEGHPRRRSSSSAAGPPRTGCRCGSSSPTCSKLGGRSIGDRRPVRPGELPHPSRGAHPLECRCFARVHSPCLHLLLPGPLLHVERGAKPVEFAYEACLECGTCLFICDREAVDWHYPPGGYGVRFRLT